MLRRHLNYFDDCTLLSVVVDEFKLCVDIGQTSSRFTSNADYASTTLKILRRL